MPDDARVHPLRLLYRRVVPKRVRAPFWTFRNYWIPRTVWKARRRLGGEAALAEHLERRMAGAEWLFVLGVNNSGTTLLSQVLGKHRELRCLPKEGQFLTSNLPADTERVSGLWAYDIAPWRWLEDHDARGVPLIKFDWIFHHRPGAKYLVEKSPPNTVRGRWLQRNFRPCRFLAIVRSPFAQCEGNRRRRGHALEKSAHHWNNAHVALAEDLPSLERAHRFTYEQLCEAPAERLAEISEFLGLTQPFDETVEQATFRIHSFDNRERPLENLNARSIAALAPEEIERIREMVAPAVRALATAGFDVERWEEEVAAHRAPP